METAVVGIEPSGAGAVVEEVKEAGAELRAQLASAREELDKSRRLLEQAKRERDVSKALLEAGAIDVEAVGALVMQTDGDIAAAVHDIRKRKPHLFKPEPRRPAQNGAAVTAGRVQKEDGGEIGTAAQAAAKGDRGALLTYLRLRRAVA